jgi:hypothetical protein
MIKDKKIVFKGIERGEYQAKDEEIQILNFIANEQRYLYFTTEFKQLVLYSLKPNKLI